MTELALVGDVGGTNCRFGLVELGSKTVCHIASFRNDRFKSLEDAIRHYVGSQGAASVGAAAIAVAGPIEGGVVSLTNHNWSFTRDTLRQAAQVQRLSLLNDFEALGLSLPHLDGRDLAQIGGEALSKPLVKIVLGPGTGFGMAILAPLPKGGWMALPTEVGHTTLPVVTQEEFDWRQRMSSGSDVPKTEGAITGGGLLLMYKVIAANGALATPEAIVDAALAGRNAIAAKTLDQFIVWLARIAGDMAMALQARGGVYLAGDIARSILPKLQSGPFRTIFEEKGRFSHIMRSIPVYVIADRHAALKGCAVAIAE
jgi:glucokinase